MTLSDHCPLCGGEKATGTTTFTVDLDGCLVVIRKVPAKVCQQCGEDWIEQDVAEQLEALVMKAVENRSEVEIVHWPSAA